MNYALRSALLIVAALGFSACAKSLTLGNAPSPTPISPSPDSAPPATSSITTPSPGSTATALTQTYREPEGAFEISLPEGYQYEATETGLIFRSADEQFRGEVVFGSAQGETYTNEQLEAFLREAYRTNLSLTKVDWQQSEVQADGSIRIDWVGTDPEGNILDAESFIEQRGDTIYILTLSGINQPYVDYLNDAQAIVASYRVRQPQTEENRE